MANPRNEGGQAIVETALLLPVAALVILCLLHLLFLIQVKVRLQRTAARLAEASALGSSTAAVMASEMPWYLRHFGWGIPGRPETRHEGFGPWRPFGGPGTVEEPGRMAIVEIPYRFRSRLAGPVAAYLGIPLSARVELPVEPTTPGESS